MKLKTVEIRQTHKLKILPEYFRACAKGFKNFEVRKNDRDFKVGDQIALVEYEGGKHTGREITGEITYITDYEQKEGYIVFSFKKWSVINKKDWGKFDKMH